MHPMSLIILFFFFLLFAISGDTSWNNPHNISGCPHSQCGSIFINYPFWLSTSSSPSTNSSNNYTCGYPGLNISCVHNNGFFHIANNEYFVQLILYESHFLNLVDMDVIKSDCPRPRRNLTLPEGRGRFFDCSPLPINKKLWYYFNCSSYDLPHNGEISCLKNVNSNGQELKSFVFGEGKIPESFELASHCQDIVVAPVANIQFNGVDPASIVGGALQKGFNLNWSTPGDCRNCEASKGRCGFKTVNNTGTYQFTCFCKDGSHDSDHCDSGKSKAVKYIAGACAGVGAVLLILAALLLALWLRRKRLRSISSKLLGQNISSDPYLMLDLEKSSSFMATQFFDYNELEEATNNFDHSKELGDGGFGVVYHGKLRDGRNVAVKRLYENNCRCVEQFKNEIKILSQLRHQSLVALYGCSSRHSRELLLVYEFIPNGTLADHLHGDCAKPATLSWPTRMCIAIETADALKYLHAVEIVHRDVKTNNILLDNSFHVKVADFGLSRLFPTNVTHISTAPQGTPGYVDPEYHRCYQLTDKSDVYSFGVVLAELISSKPAVDISRHRHEINLADLVIIKIHSGALNELVDPSLGFDSDYRINRTITSVAELAFRCLQDDKDIRPSMEEVWEVLMGIESEEYEVGKIDEVNTTADDEVLLKKMPPLSPNTVTEAWESRHTTPNTTE